MIPAKIILQMWKAHAEHPELRYAAVRDSGEWFISNSRHERSTSLAEHRGRNTGHRRWRIVSQGEWMRRDQIREGKKKVRKKKP